MHFVSQSLKQALKIMNWYWLIVYVDNAKYKHKYIYWGNNILCVVEAYFIIKLLNEDEVIIAYFYQ